jgi:hypothetical protein
VNFLVVESGNQGNSVPPTMAQCKPFPMFIVRTEEVVDIGARETDVDHSGWQCGLPDPALEIMGIQTSTKTISSKFKARPRTNIVRQWPSGESPIQKSSD